MNQESGATMAFNNVRISGNNPGDPREESDIRYNYNNLNQIICASTKLGGNQPMHHSGDGGATWLTASLSTRPGDVRQGDPTIDWTSDGTAWTVTIGISATLQLVMRTFSSPDAGATWNFDSTVTLTQTAMDKQALWIDHSPPSPYKDNMYLIWHNGAPCFVSGASRAGRSVERTPADQRSRDYGNRDRQRHQDECRRRCIRLLARHRQPEPVRRQIHQRRRAPSGRRSRLPLQSERFPSEFPRKTTALPDLSFRRRLPYRVAEPCLCGLDGSRGWGPDATLSGNEPGNNVASTCKTRIWFARSTDGGTTWDTPLQNQRPDLAE